jgi:hypothetical protein
MQEHLIVWLVMLGCIALLYAARKIPEMLRHIGNGPRGGPPTHPLPVTSSIEVSHGSGDPNNPRNWQALIKARADFKAFDKLMRRRGGKRPRAGDELPPR